ncbi:unnamed protein product [Mesocestoides corti]|uniref:Calpain catalytic domain-containing protein n=2 Tax=Mesocestoides corti TaxID=53468 RepID=A0A3P6GAP5_MESCO|nr:unnamed protein product [Mesocestoides corti]
MDGRPQIIAARFTFGTLDLLSMANEEIEVLCRPQMVNCDKPQNWKSLGRQCTDSNGRLAFQIPDAHRLPIGLHRIQLVPSSGDPDEQTVGLTMAIVPPGCDVVICSIDGSFAASLSLMGKDPKVRAGSVDIMRHWHSLGYLLIYMSARPDMQHRQVSMWLNQHNFPPGLTFFLDGLFTDPLRQKAVLLKSLIEQNQLSVHCAYGSAKDVPIYRSLGLQAHQIFAVGKLSRRQAQEATMEVERAKCLLGEALEADEQGNITDAINLYSQAVEILLKVWVRPSDYISDPTMIIAVSCFPVRQTCVTDCSFVASIAVAAQYERRFKKRLITNIIYPQKRNGEPVYNPCGKYMVKLHLNGVPRKVIIDDLLPMGQRDELLCSFSTNRNELWVSLLEKAYMKVMGGYDFPGSNSNIDLHALTGWIPERVSIKSNGSDDFDADREFRRLATRFHQGHCLVTVATGVLTPEIEQRSGLVPTHAYALLDMQQVNNTRLLLLKNPWSRTRWKGNFSELDSKNWTPELQEKLNYDLNSARYTDNGVFWIDYKSLCHFFDVFYINWNPELFPYTTCVHSQWSSSEGPKKDMYSFSNNPQYTLEVQAKSQAPVWILLTRHITNKNDFAHNNEFIGVVVYKNIKSRKVYHPNDPNPFKDSVRINSPHCLIQMVQEAGTVTYTLVVSQYEKNNTIQYTLRAYSTAPLQFGRIIDPYTFSKTVNGEWKGQTAAGCPNYPNFGDNPCYELVWQNNEVDNQVLVEMRGPREFAIGFNWDAEVLNNPSPLNHIRSTSTGNYRRGYTMLELAGLSGGKYKITVATFEPHQEGPFILSVKSTRQLTLTRCR